MIILIFPIPSEASTHTIYSHSAKCSHIVFYKAPHTLKDPWEEMAQLREWGPPEPFYQFHTTLFSTYQVIVLSFSLFPQTSYNTNEMHLNW